MRNLVFGAALAAILSAATHGANAQVVYAFTATQDPVKPGQVVEFDLTVSNLGSTATPDSGVHFTVPQYTTYGSGEDAAGTPESLDVGSLAPGQSHIFQLYFTILSGVNQAPPDGTTVTLNLTDGSNDALASRSVVTHTAPVLNLALTTGQSNVAQGTNFTYTMAYSTLGQSTSVTSGTLSVPVPAGATFVSADDGGTLSNGVVSWPVGTIAPGFSGQAHVTFSANNADQNGQLLLLEATLTDGAGDSARASDARIVTNTPELVYTITSPSGPVKPGQVIEYDVTVSNLGATTSYSGGISFIVPQYTTYTYEDYAAGTQQGADFNPIAPGQSHSFQLYFTVNSGVGNQAPPDGLAITLNCVDANGVSVSRSVVTHTAPVLNLALTTGQSNVAQGTNFTYTMAYSTLGQSTSVTSGTLSAPVPAGATFVSADDGGTLSNGVVSWPVGTIAPGFSGQAHVTFSANNADQNGQLLLLEATLTDGAGDSARASDARIVTNTPELVYTITSPSGPVKPGQVIEYDVTVSNLGATTSYSGGISFIVPQYTTYTYEDYAAGTQQGADFNPIAPGQSHMFQLYFTVNSGAGNQAPPDGLAITLNCVDGNGGGSVSRGVVTHTAPVLDLALTTGQSNVAQGTNFTYTLAYSTLGQSTSVTGGTLSVPVPAGASFVSADDGGTLSNGVVSWPVGTIAPGFSGQAHVTFSANNTDQNGQLLLLDATLTDGAGDSARASDARIVTNTPELVYTITSPSGPVKPGQVIEYDVTVSNLGATTSYSGGPTFIVPPYTTYDGYAAGTQHGLFFNPLATGQSQIFQLYFTVNSGAGNQAPPDGLAIPLNCVDANGVSVSRSVVTQETQVLNLQLSTEQSNASPLQNFTYTISYFTPGQTNLAGGQLSAAVPAGATFVSADAGGTLQNGLVNWPLGSIASGSNGQVHVTFEADANDQNGELLLTEATLTDSAGDAANASDTRIVNSTPLVIYSLNSPDNLAQPSQQIEFELTATNSGSSTFEPSFGFTVPEYTTYNGDPAGTHESGTALGWLSAGTSSTVSIPLMLTSAAPRGGVITLNLIDTNGYSVSYSIAVASEPPPPPPTPREAAGVFESLIGGDEGLLSISLAANGEFSGKITLGEESRAIKGKLNSSDNFTGTFGSIPVSLTLGGGAGGLGSYTLTGTEGGTGFVAYHAVYTKGVAAAEAGNYTAIIEPTSSDQDVPQGTGYAIMKVSSAGGVTISGRLADATPFTASGPIVGGSLGHQVVVFDRALYASKGALIGALVFSSQSSSYGAGSLAWEKPAKPGKYYPTGINTSVQYYATYYTAPKRGGTALPFTSGTFQLTDGGLANEIDQPVAFPSYDTLVATGANPADLKLKINPANGIVSGTFTDPTTHQHCSLDGILYQNTAFPQAGGYFLGPNIDGAILSGQFLLSP